MYRLGLSTPRTLNIEGDRLGSVGEGQKPSSETSGITDLINTGHLPRKAAGNEKNWPREKPYGLRTAEPLGAGLTKSLCAWASCA